MKENSVNIIILMIVVIFFAGCGKNSGKSGNNPSPAGSGYMPETEGMKLTYNNTNGYLLISKVEKVYDSGGYKVAQILNEIAGFDTYSSVSRYNDKYTNIYEYPTPAYYQSLQLLSSQPEIKQLTHKENPFLITLLHQDPLGALVCNEARFAEYHYLIGDNPPLQIDFTGTNHKGFADTLESITVPAGKFDCIRMRYSNSALFKGVPMPAVETDITCWFALKIGLVKTAAKSSSGIDLMELIKIEK